MKIVVSLLISIFSLTTWAAQVVTIPIKGMHCGSCANTVSEKIKTLSNQVAAVKVNYKSGTAAVTLKDGVVLSKPELESAISDVLKGTEYTVEQTASKN